MKLCPEMHVIRYVLNFDKHHEEFTNSINPFFVTPGLVFVFGLFLRLVFALLFMCP